MFHDIAQFKSVVGGAVNQSMDIDSIMPTVETTYQLHLAPVLGQDFADEIWQAFEDGDLSVYDEKLLKALRKALGLLTLYEYSSIGAVQFSESGLHRVETETVRTAYRYQEEEYLRKNLTSGYEAIEQLQRHLESNHLSYSAYSTSPERRRFNKNLLRFASELRASYSKYITRYALECMRPVLEEVQCFAIEGNLPSAFVDDLVTKNATGQLSTIETTLVELMQRIITEFTIMESLARNWVQIDGNRVVHHEHKNGVLRSDLGRASDNAVSLAMRHHNHKGSKLIAKMFNFITEHEEDFPLAFCQPGTWNDETTDWVTGTGDQWAYAYNNADRCLLPASALATPPSEKCCPERHLAAASDLPSTAPCTRSAGCGCGCDGGDSCSGHNNKKSGITMF